MVANVGEFVFWRLQLDVWLLIIVIHVIYFLSWSWNLLQRLLLSFLFIVVEVLSGYSGLADFALTMRDDEVFSSDAVKAAMAAFLHLLGHLGFKGSHHLVFFRMLRRAQGGFQHRMWSCLKAVFYQNIFLFNLAFFFSSLQPF